jgi:hypothetical protein
MKSDQLDDFKNVIIPFEPLKKYDNASVSNGSSTIPKLGTRLIGSNYVVTETKKRKRDNEW